MPGLLINRNCEITNGCCFKPPSLWLIITQQQKTITTLKKNWKQLLNIIDSPVNVSISLIVLQMFHSIFVRCSDFSLNCVSCESCAGNLPSSQPSLSPRSDLAGPADACFPGQPFPGLPLLISPDSLLRSDYSQAILFLHRQTLPNSPELRGRGQNPSLWLRTTALS